MKIRHILLALLVVLAIAFMQPLVTFLGGLTLLLGVGGLIFRDLSPASQDAVERRLLGWLQQIRTTGSLLVTSETTKYHRRLPDSTDSATAAERLRRGRAKPSARLQETGNPASTGRARDATTGKDPSPTI